MSSRAIRKRALTAATIAASAVALAGCGNSSASSGKSGESVTVAIAATQVCFGPAYVAQTQGMYKDQGVAVKLMDNTGANTTTYVASKKADLGEIGPGGPLLMAKQGRETMVVYQQVDAAAAAYMFAPPSVKSIDEVRGKRFGTFSLGSASYGFAQHFNRTLKLNAKITPFQDTASAAGALVSGQLAAANGSYTEYADLVKQGKAHLLVDPNDPAQREKYVGPSYPSGVTFGLADGVKAKKKAVVAYLAAREDALAWMRAHSTEEVVAELRKSKVFASQSADSLSEAVERGLDFCAPKEGVLDKKTWQTTLDNVGTWGLDGFDPKDSIYDYDSRVDMTYLDEAKKKENGE